MEAAASAPDWRGEFLIKFALRVIRRAAAAVVPDGFQRGAFIRICLFYKKNIYFKLLYFSVKNRSKKVEEQLGSMMSPLIFMLDTNLTLLKSRSRKISFLLVCCVLLSFYETVIEVFLLPSSVLLSSVCAPVFSFLLL